MCLLVKSKIPNAKAFGIFGAGDRNRTGTGITTHGILSPGRLPVPPHQRILYFTIKNPFVNIENADAV